MVKQWQLKEPTPRLMKKSNPARQYTLPRSSLWWKRASRGRPAGGRGYHERSALCAPRRLLNFGHPKPRIDAKRWLNGIRLTAGSLPWTPTSAPNSRGRPLQQQLQGIPLRRRACYHDLVAPSRSSWKQFPTEQLLPRRSWKPSPGRHQRGHIFNPRATRTGCAVNLATDHLYLSGDVETRPGAPTIAAPAIGRSERPVLSNIGIGTRIFLGSLSAT